MKKLLGIVVLGLLWCNVGYAKYIELDKCFIIETTQHGILKKHYGNFEDYRVLEIKGKNHELVSEYYSSGTKIIHYDNVLFSIDTTNYLIFESFIYSDDYVLYKDRWDQGYYSKQIKEGKDEPWKPPPQKKISKRTYKIVDVADKFIVAEIVNEFGKEILTIDTKNSVVHSNYNKNIGSGWRSKFQCNKTKEEELLAEIDDNELLAASSGTGFFVSKEGHIVTNFHVIEDCDSIKVNFKRKEIEAEIFATDKINDLAIIKTNFSSNKIFPVSNKDVTLLQDIIVAGFPLGKNISSVIKTHPGKVTALAGFEDNFSNFQTDATINQGNSGGPIIDEYGNVIGIAVATWVEEGVQGIHFGIKSSVLKTFANAKGLNFSAPNYRKIPKEKLGELISEATIYLECWMTGAKVKKMIAEANNQKALFSKYK